MTTIQEEATVQSDGTLTLEVHSPRLRAGEKVMVYVVPVATEAIPATNGAKLSWRDFAGCLEEGDPNGSDNESIDRDLAASYLDKHEPE